ncbi:MAG TPA: tyrosine-type recombinase/integrase [Solirubrobacteraceae bacterium]|nr:tyrosine-type recombinase/integrase [Solirubrobacteraceae bacterium]
MTVANGKKSNGKWVDRWREGGRHRQRTFERRGDRDAFRMERIRRQQLGGLVRLEHPVTLAEFMETYWRLHAIPNLEPKTREMYRQQWGKHILPRIGDQNLRAVTPSIINHELVAPMRAAKVGEPTIRQTLMVLQAIFSYASAADRITENPVRKVTKPRQTIEREVPPVPPALVERLRARLSARDALMVSVLAYSGLRPQELLALHWEDVVDGVLVVRRKNVHGELFPYTKTRQNRRVKLLAPLAADLAEWKLATGRRGGLVVPRQDGGPWTRWDWANWRNRVYKPHATAIGLRTPIPYDLRGSFVSLLAAEGHTLLYVARQAGHSVAVCDRHYAGIFNGVDPAKRTTAEDAIRAAREPGVRGVCALFDITTDGGAQ